MKGARDDLCLSCTKGQQQDNELGGSVPQVPPIPATHQVVLLLVIISQFVMLRCPIFFHFQSVSSFSQEGIRLYWVRCLLSSACGCVHSCMCVWGGDTIVFSAAVICLLSSSVCSLLQSSLPAPLLSRELFLSPSPQMSL